MKLANINLTEPAALKELGSATFPIVVLSGFAAATYFFCMFLSPPFNLLMPIVATVCFAAVLFASGRLQMRLHAKFRAALKYARFVPYRLGLIRQRSTPPALVDLNALPIAIIALSKDGRITQSNTSAQEILRLKAHESPTISDLMEEPGRSITQWLDAAFYSTEPPAPEIVRLKRAEEDHYIQIMLKKCNAPDCDLIAVLNDATKMRTLETQFIQSQKMQAIGQLAGGVAHDFNNLLTAIGGYCDLVQLSYDKHDSGYGDLVQISQTANRATILVRQLLAFSRQQTLEPKPVAINKVLSEYIHLLNRLVGENTQMRLDYSKSLPDAFVDVGQLEQVIMNLVVNASDAMPEGGNIWLKTRAITYQDGHTRDSVPIAAGQYVCVEVADEGVGMTEATRGKVFEPFFTTKPQGSGTGLGLSTVYGIIKQTGGYIFVDSVLGQGANFTLLLPIVQSSKVADTPPVLGESRGSNLRGKVILLVEDEAPVRSFAVRALELQGARVVEAESGEEALALVKAGKHGLDLILTDIVMPGLSGTEWARLARPYCKGIPVVFTSGYSKDSDQVRGNGADRLFIPKPFNLGELVSSLDEIIGQEEMKARGDSGDFGGSGGDSGGDSGADSAADLVDDNVGDSGADSVKSKKKKK